MRQPASTLTMPSVALALLCLLAGGTARGQERKAVAVLEVVGAPRVFQTITQALRKSYRLVPLAQWHQTAMRFGVLGRTTDEIATVAGELKADAVVTAAVKKDKESGKWTLHVSARHGATGKIIERLRYPLKGPRVDPVTLRQLANEIAAAVEQAIIGPMPEPTVAEAPDLKPVEPPGKEENPFEAVQRVREEEGQKSARRSSLYPWFDVGAGFILGGRRFFFEEEPGPSPVKCYTFERRIIDPADPGQMRTVFRYSNALRKCPGFAASVAGGLRLDATIYPLAWLHSAPLRGLGVGGTFDYFFWPASRVCNRRADGICVSEGAELETRQLRFEAGLRWMWNILNRRNRPVVMMSFMYGYHQFSIQKEKACYDQMTGQKILCAPGMGGMLEGIDDHGLPDLRYQYLDIGLGGRVPYVGTDKWQLALLIDFHYHAMLDYGEIQVRFTNNDPSDPTALYQGGGYGPVSGGYGLRVGFTPVEFVWKGLTARLQGYFETFAMSFDLGNTDKGNSLPPVNREATGASRHIAQGATDQYFGGVLQLGYQY